MSKSALSRVISVLIIFLTDTYISRECKLNTGRNNFFGGGGSWGISRLVGCF